MKDWMTGWCPDEIMAFARICKRYIEEDNFNALLPKLDRLTPKNRAKLMAYIGDCTSQR